MSLLGREITPPAVVGRPRFRYYPGPPTAAVVSIPFIALTAFGYLTFRASSSPGFYAFIAGCTGLMLLMAVTTFIIWMRFGARLSLRELGVVLNEQEIPYAQIDALTVYDKRRYDETATVRALTRTITIETAGRKVQAQFVAPRGEALDQWLILLAERIAAQERPRAGRGWRVEQGTLETRRERVAVSAITAAGVFERDVRLWKHHDEQHFFSVPLDSKNARVLLALAQRGTSAVPAEPTAEPSSSTGIGRLLFARRTSLISGVGNTLVAAFLIGIGWMCLERFLHLSAKLALGIAIGAFVLWIFYSIYRATVRYAFHERAIVRTSPLGTRTLAYANVATMQWHETGTTLEHAIPMGKTLKAKLVPDDGSPAVSIRSHRFRDQEGDLERVRSAIALHIAQRLRAQLDRGEEIAWTSNAKLTRDGLVLKREIIPYGQPINAHFNDGFLIFYRDTPRKPLALLATGDLNFYPGLALFEMVTGPTA